MKMKFIYKVFIALLLALIMFFPSNSRGEDLAVVFGDFTGKFIFMLLLVLFASVVLAPEKETASDKRALSKPKIRTVGFRTRFFAFVLDYLILVAALQVIVALVAYIATGVEHTEIYPLLFFAYALVGFPVLMMFLEAFYNTPGKKLLKIKATKENRSRLGVKEALIRRLDFLIFGVIIYAFPFIIPNTYTGYGVGAILSVSAIFLVFFDVIYMFRSDRPLRQRYFDKLAHTVVIEEAAKNL
jgi:uncharacterized RDD family membrane protein YckC